MGKSVRIVDLARKMIRLSGLTVENDIPIRFTGLRPGEKLYEELLNQKENTLPTHHPLILTARVMETDPVIMETEIGKLIGMAEHATDMDLVRKMKQIVPEYKSQSSVYEILDHH